MSSVRRLVTKIHAARPMLDEAQAALDAICSTTPPECLSQWAIDEQHAQSTRGMDPTAMKIYNIQIKKGNPANSAGGTQLIDFPSGVTKAQMQVRLLDEENRRNDLSGQSTLISEGLRLEEQQ